MAGITFDSVGKVYPGGTRAVTDVNLEVGDGEFMVLVGPSGCGKSTLLRMVAGLEDISEGELKIGDRVVNDVPPKDRDIAMVFQNYALYPHMSVFDNMAFGLKLRKMPKDEIKRRVADAAKTLEITEYLDRKPKALSGGQRQRVAMGRAIVREPSAFLMDEPLSNLDAKLRVQMRSELGLLHARLQTTTLYVTHDQVEAMTMGDRVAVIRKGTLQQADTPRVLYDEPVNLFVAGFIGSPSMNFIYGTLLEEDGGLIDTVRRAEAGRGPLCYCLPTRLDGLRRQRDGDRGAAGELRGGRGGSRRRSGRRPSRSTADITEQLGSEAYVHFISPQRPVVTPDIRELLEDEGLDETSLGNETKMVARVNPDLAPKSGETTRLWVDTSKLHFFDLDTGLAIWD